MGYPLELVESIRSFVSLSSATYMPSMSSHVERRVEGAVSIEARKVDGSPAEAHGHWLSVRQHYRHQTRVTAQARLDVGRGDAYRVE